jgi:hypothetical protein
VVKLSHDAGLTKEVSPLLVCVTSFQSLDGHTDFSLARHLETATADFAKFTFERKNKQTKILRWTRGTFKVRED